MILTRKEIRKKIYDILCRVKLGGLSISKGQRQLIRLVSSTSYQAFVAHSYKSKNLKTCRLRIPLIAKGRIRLLQPLTDHEMAV